MFRNRSRPAANIARWSPRASSSALSPDADRGLLTRDGAPVDAGHRAVLLLQALLRAEVTPLRRPN
jgi:hypothetical protein